MAQVYKAYHARLRREVAIKVIHSQIADSQNFKARFELEAQVIASLEHPNIVSIYDFGEEGNFTYLAMQYVSGGTLRDQLRDKRPLEASDAINYTIQILHALHHAHLRGIVHRDVKPQNMLISGINRRHILLSDFGIAKLYAGNEDSIFSEMPTGAITLTGVDQIIGTADYMSPEQALGNPVDARADIYALGIVFYQMLTGDVPFHSTTVRGVLFQQVSTPAPSARTKNPLIPEALAQIIAKSLEKMPENRFQTAEDMAQALEAVPSFFSELRMISSTSYASLHQATTLFDIPCPNCGIITSSDNHFCPNCGHPLIATSSTNEPTSVAISQPTHLDQRAINPPNISDAVIPIEDNQQLQNNLLNIPEYPTPVENSEEALALSIHTCPYCAAETGIGDHFCLNCGNRLLLPPTLSQTKPSVIVDATLANAKAATDPQTKIENPSRFLIRNASGNVIQEYVLDKPEVVIGRLHTCDISLTNDKLTSRRHAIIRYENGHYFLYDEYSSTGTFVNGHEIEGSQPYALKNNDHVSIGEYELIFLTFALSTLAELPTIMLPEQTEGTIGTRFPILPERTFATTSASSAALSEGQTPVEEVETLLNKTPADASPLPTLAPGQTIEQLLDEGAHYYKTKQYNDALGIYSYIIQVDTQNVEAYGNKGNVLGKLERYKDALDAYDSALAIDDKHDSIWNARGDLLFKQKKYKEAIISYDAALAIKPNNIVTLATKGEALSRLKRYDEALIICNQALDISPSHAHIWVTKGNVLWKQRSYDEALNAYDAALKLNPKDATTWITKGKILWKLERFEEALVANTRATELVPRKYLVWASKGEVLLQLKRYTEALSAFDRSHILNPGDANVTRKCKLLRDLLDHRDELAQTRIKENVVNNDLPEKRQTGILNNHDPQAGQRFTQVINYQAQKEHMEEEVERTEVLESFDIFLCHSLSDTQWGTWIEDHLATPLEDDFGFRVWLPKWRMAPGTPWEPAWNHGMDLSRCYAICVSKQTSDEWFQQEIQRVLKQKQKKPSLRFLAVLLPDQPSRDLDAFPDLITWVDFNHPNQAYAFHILVCGIKGVPPGSPLKLQTEATNTWAATTTEERLRDLQQFKHNGLIDESVAQEFQRIVLQNIWLSISESKG